MKNTFYSKKNITIINEDFLLTNEIEQETIDLIITSPPYNIGINYNTYSDTLFYEKYLEFTEKWLEKSYKLLKKEGRICANIPFDVNIPKKNNLYIDFVTIAKKTGFNYQTTIIWNKQNISKRTAWGSWISATAPAVIAQIEVIAVMHRGDWKRDGQERKTAIDKQEFINWTNGIWNIHPESSKKIGHPAPFPLELSKRCLKLFSFEQDTILDPFVGSGTTLVSSYLLNRKAIGVEIDNMYCEMAINRLKNDGKIDQKKIGDFYQIMIKKEHKTV